VCERCSGATRRARRVQVLRSIDSQSAALDVTREGRLFRKTGITIDHSIALVRARPLLHGLHALRARDVSYVSTRVTLSVAYRVTLYQLVAPAPSGDGGGCVHGPLLCAVPLVLLRHLICMPEQGPPPCVDWRACTTSGALSAAPTARSSASNAVR
jgi:hypothetical protein